MTTTSLAIVADFDSQSRSHTATNDAIAHCASALGVAAEPRWIQTADLARPEGLKRLADFRGIWIGPGSPYASSVGAACRAASRESRLMPLLRSLDFPLADRVSINMPLLTELLSPRGGLKYAGLGLCRISEPSQKCQYRSNRE